jgi:hypothetical protein
MKSTVCFFKHLGNDPVKGLVRRQSIHISEQDDAYSWKVSWKAGTLRFLSRPILTSTRVRVLLFSSACFLLQF